MHPSFIVMQLCESNLKNIIYNKDPLEDRKLIFYLKGIVEGLILLKQQHIIYGDIKPQNILLDNDIIKIGDLDYIVRYKFYYLEKNK